MMAPFRLSITDILMTIGITDMPEADLSASLISLMSSIRLFVTIVHKYTISLLMHIVFFCIPLPILRLVVTLYLSLNSCAFVASVARMMIFSIGLTRCLISFVSAYTQIRCLLLLCSAFSKFLARRLSLTSIELPILTG